MPLAPGLFIVIVEEMPHMCLDPEKAYATERDIGAGGQPEIPSRAGYHLPDAHECKQARPFVRLVARTKA